MSDTVYTDSRKYKLGHDLEPGDVVLHDGKVWVVSEHGDYKYLQHGYDVEWVMFGIRYAFVLRRKRKKMPTSWGYKPKLIDLLDLGFDILCEVCQEPYTEGDKCKVCYNTSFYQVDKMGDMGVRVVGKIQHTKAEDG